MATHRRHGRATHRTILRSVVPATLIAALATVSALSIAQAADVVPPAAPPPSSAPAAVGPTVAQLIPAPPVPARFVPEFPLPSPQPEPEPEEQESTSVVYTCEPWADAKFEDPANPHFITNKDCPELNAAKEQAQREYSEQLDHGADEVGSDGLEGECSNPSSRYYGTAACGGDVDSDGVIDGS